MSAPPILTNQEITELQTDIERLRQIAAAAMYRTDAHERPYHAGRGEMYRMWNLLGQASGELEKLRGMLYPERRV